MNRVKTLGALSATAVLCAAGSAAAADQRGAQRLYSGTAWGDSAQAITWRANLQLDRARVRDGGFIAQTLWGTTNDGRARFGTNRKRTAYVQLALSRGFQGADGNFLTIAGRDVKGAYYEKRVEGSFQMGKPYPVSITSSVGTGPNKTNQWKFFLNTLDEVGTLNNTGDGVGSNSAYAGIESSSPRNSAAGRVDKLNWTVVLGKASGFPKDCWKPSDNTVAGQADVSSELIRRGPAARVSWTKRYCSIRNSFGR